MSRCATITRCTLAALVASTVALTPAAQATSSENHTGPSAADTAARQDGKTHIEYRSEADRLAFETLGQYIQTSADGTVSEKIPDSVRHSHKDYAGRIDEFVNIANAAQTKGNTPPITTYGNETKIDGWGPVQRIYISHDTLSKATKVIQTGGGVAGVATLLASEGLAGPAGWVAAGLTALASAGSLCDWNDQGIIIWQIPGVPLPGCTPQK